MPRKPRTPPPDDTAPATGTTMAEVGMVLQGAALRALRPYLANPATLNPGQAAAIARAGAIIQRMGIEITALPRREAVTGRVAALSDTVFASIITSLCGGSTLISAAAVAGVSAGTVNEWIARGKGTAPRDRTARFAAFAEAVDRAREFAVDVAVNAMHESGVYGRGGQPPDWRAAAEWLKLMHPKEFSNAVRVEVEMSELREKARKVALEMGLDESDADAVLAMAAQVAAAAGSNDL